MDDGTLARFLRGAPPGVPVVTSTNRERFPIVKRRTDRASQETPADAPDRKAESVLRRKGSLVRQVHSDRRGAEQGSPESHLGSRRGAPPCSAHVSEFHRGAFHIIESASPAGDSAEWAFQDSCIPQLQSEKRPRFKVFKARWVQGLVGVCDLWFFDRRCGGRGDANGL